MCVYAAAGSWNAGYDTRGMCFGVVLREWKTRSPRERMTTSQRQRSDKRACTCWSGGDDDDDDRCEGGKGR